MLSHWAPAVRMLRSPRQLSQQPTLLAVLTHPPTGPSPYGLLQEELRSAAVLVLANKQDLPGAISPAQLTDMLGLHSLRGRTW